MSKKEEIIVLADGKKITSDNNHKYKIVRFNAWKPIRRIQKARYLKELCEANTVKAIYADSWKSVELLKNIKNQILILAHGTEIPKKYIDDKTSFKKTIKKNRIIKSFYKCTYIIANSNYTKELLIESLKINPKKIVIIHPGIDIYDQFITSKDESTINNHIGHHHPILITLARLEKRKGHTYVLNAIKNLINKYPNVLYIIAGDGPYKKELINCVKKLDIEKNILFLGWITEPEKSLLLKKSNIFIMTPTIEKESVEGFGMSFIDAAFHGVATIGTKSGGIADAIIDKKTGLLCEVGDQLDIDTKLEKLISDVNYRLELGRHAKEHAFKEYTWDKKAVEYLSVIDL
jgi:phosphatidylinositol alpha-1,6-mannosyltransferase